MVVLLSDIGYPTPAKARRANGQGLRCGKNAGGASDEQISCYIHNEECSLPGTLPPWTKATACFSISTPVLS